MEQNKKIAREIFEMAKEISKKVEEDSPEIITDITDDDNAYKTRCYYFENGEMYGGIIQEETGCEYEWKGPCMIPIKKDPKYTIQSSVDYINSNGQLWGFAKVRIFEEDDQIQIRGSRVGSWESPNYEDIDFLKTPDEELAIVLDAFRTNISSIHQAITQNCRQAVKKYDTKWIQSLRRTKI